MNTENVDVLIVGAGPVGLSLAIELGTRGVRCMVIEQNDRVGLNPRAKTTNVRTREHLRRWGIADKLRAAGKLPPGYPSDMIFVTRLNGPQLTKIENAFNCSPEQNDLYSESAQWIPQYILEEVLRAHAVTIPGVEVRFNSSFVSATQDADSVTTTIADMQSSQEFTVRSAYVAGADGARSAVRKTVGAEMQGRRNIAQNFNVQFRSPELTALNKHDRAIMYWQINTEFPSILGPMEGLDLWYWAAAHVDESVSQSDAKELIQKSTGFRFEMEIVGSSPWAASSLIADKYSNGRIFLAGDACHLHPPFGGYGMNMGVADAVDLGWKLAANLRGWGGAELLASYEQERRPVHRWIIDEAIANYNALGNQLAMPGIEAPGPGGDATRRAAGDSIFAAKLREFKTLGAVLGYQYASPCIIDDGTPAPPLNSMVYQQSAHPGCLAPHIWLADGTSLYDHFGEGFTLLALGEGHEDSLSAAASSAEAVQVPLKTLPVHDPRLRLRYAAAFALIRPDQHVAWRGDALPADFTSVLRQVTGQA